MREMKDSGIEWIGEIPKDWEVCRIKDIIEKTKEGIKIGPFGSSLTNKVLDAGPYKIYGQWNIVGKDFKAGKNFISKETFLDLSSYMIKTGDILISMMGTIGKCSIIPLDINEGIMDSHVIKIRLNHNIIKPIFFEYFYDKDNCNIVITQLSLMKKGSIMDGINSTIVKNINIVLPSLQEQHRIATFLDEKCKDIDTLITLQEEMIAELQAYKQSVIAETVTKGLNPNVTMKDSGVEWIGEIPEHWTIMRLNELGSYRKGPFGSALKISMFVPKNRNTVKVYEQQNAIKKDWKLGCAYISSEYYNLMKNFTVLPGDLIVSCAGTIGEIYEIPQNAELGIINQALMRMSMNRKFLNINFFIHLFSISIKNVSNTKSNGSAIKNIPPFEVLKKIRIPVPSIEEQQQVISYLDTKCSQIDELITLKQQKITELQDYKKSLIYEYVTGKKEVPVNN